VLLLLRLPAVGSASGSQAPRFPGSAADAAALRLRPSFCFACCVGFDFDSRDSAGASLFSIANSPATAF
jgi:hypothetical protein